jgi:hypothetical protein
MNRSLKAGVAVVAAGGLFAIGGMSSAVAAKLIHGDDIAKQTITSANLAKDSVGRSELKPGVVHDGARGPRGMQGPRGPQGPKGESGLKGAYYSVAFYDVGDTNAGAIATVACKAETDVAISGGVQVLGLDDAANSRNTPVSSSFPGRMDWSTNKPRADRLDGWIVQFGGNAGASSDKSPEKTKIWALCVPGTDIPVEQTYTQSDD